MSTPQAKAAARQRFEAVYPIVRDDLLKQFEEHSMPKEAVEYYRRVRSSLHIYHSMLILE